MKHFLSAALMLCIGFFFAACSESVEEEYVANYGEIVKVHFDIAAENPAPQTRAANEGNYVADVEAWELIKQYRVAFANPTSGAIYAVVDKDLGNTNTKEADPIDLELRAGSYKAYAFANIDFETLNTLGIVKGGTIPADLDTKRFFVEKYFSTTSTEKNLLPMETFRDDFDAGLNVGIPMTSVNGQPITITERINQTFAIEVRRLFAKLQFDYSYRMPVGSPDLLLKSQSMTNVTVNNGGTPAVLLMNYEEARNAINLPTTFTFEKLSHTYAGTGKLLKANGDTGAKLFSQSFYVLESQGNTATNSFELDFDIEKADGTTPEDDKVRYSITDPDHLTLIHRNDWIVIPVNVSEWLMDIDVYCYPPIGGYPEAHIEAGATEFHVTFDSPGDIALYLNFHRFYDPSSKFYLTDASRIKNVTVVGPTGDDIFMAGKKPKYAAGEITAALENVEGTAYIDVTVEFIPNPAQPLVTKILKRRIYMTRKGII